ncbi:MAG: peptidylprolyl isomerase [Candidatus Aminicenantes bacterium]|nr:peptidylprolyl isomerase [Candidatus Aminicenantes bacterium]
MKGNRMFALAGVAVIALAGLFSACGAPKYPEGLYAEVSTVGKGMFVFKIDFEHTPMTAANFVGLAEGTIANGAVPAGALYFNGTKWHRVVPGHVIQCGIPKDGNDDGLGYSIPNEIYAGITHGKAGTVGMANGGPHTNGSQWYVTLGDRTYLDGIYTAWGEVVEGLDVVMSIVQGDEVETVKIVRVGKAAKAFRPTTESFKTMTDAAWARVKKEDEDRKAAEDAAVAAGWPEAVEAENGVKYVVTVEGKGKILKEGDKVQVAYSGKCLLSGMTFVSTTENGTPYPGKTPAAFEYEVGKTRINPGFNAQIAAMKKGEKRTVIVPADQAYRNNGFFARQREGEKRFVIPPAAMLVYEIEVLK